MIIPPWKRTYTHEALHLNILEPLPSLKVAFLHSLLDIGPVVLEKKLMKSLIQTDVKAHLGFQLRLALKR